MTRALAHRCARHPWFTIGAWTAAIVLALALVSTLLGGNLTSRGNVTNNPESLRANELLSERFPRLRVSHELVVVRSDRLRADAEEQGRAMRQTLSWRVTSPLRSVRRASSP